MNRTRILIIDDEPQLRKLLQIALEAQDYDVLLADDGKTGITLAASQNPDLILLDLSLPDQSGHEILRELRSWFIKPVIILSVQDNEKDIVAALDNGASDYIPKPFRTQELLARIRAALRSIQNTAAGSSRIICDDLDIDLSAHTIKKNGELLKLTGTEFNLVAVLAKNQGRVLTHQFILKQVWGQSYQHETQYLRVFIAAIRKKIETDPTNPLHIITESGVGYRFN
ncbi:MAG: response regulator [Niabella sp.]|nr:response regulator [Niabella sp.]